jgi:hypothetical protein
MGALHIAAWLHDCGKVTTPEYVVDKATKLETLNDRIHEIRTRFEVLKRDAWVRYWQAVAMGDEQDLSLLRDATLTALDDDFAFIARCNLGGEAMAKPTCNDYAALANAPGPEPWMTGWAFPGRRTGVRNAPRHRHCRSASRCWRTTRAFVRTHRRRTHCPGTIRGDSSSMCRATNTIAASSTT